MKRFPAKDPPSDAERVIFVIAAFVLLISLGFLAVKEKRSIDFRDQSKALTQSVTLPKEASDTP